MLCWILLLCTKKVHIITKTSAELHSTCNIYDPKFFSSTAQKMEFSIKDFFSKCDQISRKLRIWSYLLKKSLMKNFIFYAVTPARDKKLRLTPLDTPSTWGNDLYMNFTNTIFALTVCSCHVTYAFESESTLYSCLNV